MKIHHILERDSTVLGLALREAGVLSAIFVCLCIVLSFLAAPWWIYLIILGLMIYVILWLRTMRKAGQPDYFQSWISFHFLQPKEITFIDPIHPCNPRLHYEQESSYS